ncbi:ribosomal RNA processing protein 1 homolog A-like [Leptodactylus fuscus]|uniref:ribosomal RNA processing protein 1 homolog A-like n=1 Tax=Leptodactylus fuscus TaxID=238119 RepID=UPI003F4F2D54
MADPSIQLAQRLAANDKKSRDRALRKLRRYLSLRSADPEGGFTADEFCKIWKGLFYCMWMQDKPLLQEELALTMSQLVHTLQTRPSQNLFLRSFWQTLNREWNGIDRLRLDKFYTLIRLVLRQSVELLKKGEWEESLLKDFLSILEDEVLKAEAPRGVQHHLTDIYLDELAKVGSSELSADLNLKLIEPFCKIAAKAKDYMLRQSVVSGIFQTILDQSPFAIEDLMKEVGHTAENDDESEAGDHQATDSEDIGPVLQFDYQAVADRLFNLASRKNITARNRKNLYRLVKRFKDLAEGIFPPDSFPEEVSTDEDDYEYTTSRFRKRQRKAQAKLALNSEDAVTEPLKKGKRAAVTAENPPEQPPAAKKKRKKNGSNIGEEKQPEVNGVNHTNSDITEESAPPSPPEPDASLSSVAISRLKRRRRSSLLRLSLSVLPLRGVSMIRRRRLLRERRKMLSCKTAPITSMDVVTSCPEVPCSAPKAASKAAPSTHQDFITFQKLEVPKPLYIKGSKNRGRPISTKSISKKVTFSLNKNMTTEFKRTDRSLLVSPTGSSRIPFNPNQRPQHSVLKSPVLTNRPTPRAKAADFF